MSIQQDKDLKVEDIRNNMYKQGDVIKDVLNDADIRELSQCMYHAMYDIRFEESYGKSYSSIAKNNIYPRSSRDASNLTKVAFLVPGSRFNEIAEADLKLNPRDPEFFEKEMIFLTVETRWNYEDAFWESDEILADDKKSAFIVGMLDEDLKPTDDPKLDWFEFKEGKLNDVS